MTYFVIKLGGFVVSRVAAVIVVNITDRKSGIEMYRGYGIEKIGPSL